ncbi:MAG: CRISPR-associated endoribonuclease Cas6 [Bacteroidia bacterium]|nr:CRISPR-associated endoribonuclease Cas6 [Bacteroidia bacterium]MDW8301144.1 CRISPR-associated endoribonuclease Cas6 [Bacteroidia bacterium]
MKVKIILNKQSKYGLVPFNHLNELYQLILGIMESKYSVFEPIIKPYAKTHRDFNLFTFSGIKGFSKVENNALNFQSKKLSWVISSPIEAFLDKVLDELFRMPVIKIGDILVNPIQTEVIPAPNFHRAIKYLALSPLVLDREEQNIHSPESETFSDKLFDSTIRRMIEFYGDSLPYNQMTEFQFIPDKEYLERMKNQRKEVAREYTTVKYGKVKTYLMPFVLYAHPKIHEFVWDTGVGDITEEGFGGVDVLK